MKLFRLGKQLGPIGVKAKDLLIARIGERFYLAFQLEHQALFFKLQAEARQQALAIFLPCCAGGVARFIAGNSFIDLLGIRNNAPPAGLVEQHDALNQFVLHFFTRRNNLFFGKLAVVELLPDKAGKS